MPKKKGVIEKLAQMADSWYNEVTGLGTVAMDRLANHTQNGVVPTPPAYLSALYHDDGLARKIATKPVLEAMRLGVDWATSADIDPDEKRRWAEAIAFEFTRLDLVRKVSEAAVWSRVFGLGAVLVGSSDEELKEPLMEPVRQPLDYAVVLERYSHTLRPYCWYCLDDGVANVGEPKLYQASRIGDTSQFSYIHETRLLIFHGELTAYDVRQNNDYIDLPILHWCWEALRQYDSSRKSIGLALTDASQVVLKIKGLFDGLLHQTKTAIQTRFQVVDMAKMSGRVMPIDEEEDYSVHDRAFTGVADLLDRDKSHLAAVAEMPETELYGRSAAGMNATGEGDTRSWYQKLQTERDAHLGPALDRATVLVAQSLGAPSPETWHVTWPSLWQMDPDQETAHRKAVAETDAINIQQQVVTPEEVRATRYSTPGEFNDGPVGVDLMADETEPPDQDVQVQELVASAVEESLLAIQAGPGPAAEQPPGLPTKETSPALEPAPTPAQGTQEMPSTEEAAESLKMLERLVKAGAPSTMTQAMTTKIAEQLGIATSAVLASIRGHEFLWYTDPKKKAEAGELEDE